MPGERNTSPQFTSTFDQERAVDVIKYHDKEIVRIYHYLQFFLIWLAILTVSIVLLAAAVFA